MIEIDFYSESNSIGWNHEENQDSLVVDEKNFLFAVADGVGGYGGAKDASSLAASKLGDASREITEETSLVAKIREIHSEIQDKGKRAGFQNMGTTIAVAKVLREERKMIHANVGDSSIFLLEKDGNLRTISIDDSFRSSDPGSMWAITQYVGMPEYEIEVHSGTIEYQDGDVVIICSDGITDNLLSNRSSTKNFVDLVIEYRSAKKLVMESIEARIKADDLSVILVFL